MLDSRNPANRKLLDDLMLKAIEAFGELCTTDALVKKFQIGEDPILESLVRLREAGMIDLGDMKVKRKL